MSRAFGGRPSGYIPEALDQLEAFTIDLAVLRIAHQVDQENAIVKQAAALAPTVEELTRDVHAQVNSNTRGAR